jgi:hypothetical protein
MQHAPVPHGVRKVRILMCLAITLAILAATLAALATSRAAAAPSHPGTPSHHAASASQLTHTTPPLVYICQIQPCTNDQEFEVFDNHGNPGFSVGEFGGAAVFGDNLSVYPPGNVYYPSWVLSYTTPAQYDAQHPGAIQAEKCEAPAVWLAPGTGGIHEFVCVNGAWQLSEQALPTVPGGK